MYKQVKSIVKNGILVLKNPSLLKRGTPILWPIQRARTEWLLESKNQSEQDLIRTLTGIDQIKLQDIMSEVDFEARAKSLYSLVRIMKPTLVVETGVSIGNTSRAFLTAMERNQYGELYSIDLPTETRLSDGLTYRGNPAEVGKLVPQDVRYRWHLILGDSRTELPTLLNKVKEIDFFFHDSLHTEEHMFWEFKTAWPFIRNGGILLSDDIGVSFLKFLKQCEYKNWGCSGPYSSKLGAVVKGMKQGI
jgi:predicted O-methyltransferase YrrM